MIGQVGPVFGGRVGRGDAKASLAFSVPVWLLVFHPLPALASASSDMGSYGLRLTLGALLLCALFFGLSRLSRAPWFRRRFPLSGRCRLLGTLPLGRDALYIVRCGPEVIAVVSGRGGATVIGRWDRALWEKDDGDEA